MSSKTPADDATDARHAAREPLVCPSCATTYPLDERFCPRCGMPLVYAGGLGVEEPVTATHERARKIKKQYAEGDLVRVAGARNLAEAEFIQGLLLEEGVPSILRRSRGFDVPDFLAAGPRDIMVPASGAATAGEVLLQSDLAPPAMASPPMVRVALGLLAAFAVVALVAWLISLSAH
ncbi:MAG: hypothetical protein DLM63_01915 [Solirubrobacterales bacterium]|nr:MAG: hypothetical protein DLM63_01915 [Solirubrobacterales bacterium]